MIFSELQLDGELHFVGFLRDITKRKEAERAVRDSNERLEHRVAERTRELREANERLMELDRMKSQFLATMSHELRTPLNSILGFTSLMREGMAGPLTDEQRRQLGFVHGSGEHLLALINDLLDLSRIESGRMDVAMAPFDFAAVAAEVGVSLKPLIMQKGLRLEFGMAGTPADGGRPPQVLPGAAQPGQQRREVHRARPAFASRPACATACCTPASSTAASASGRSS